MTNFIDNKELSDLFKHHLSLPDNNRIIFSSKFGMGKSSFLRNYFDVSKEYNVIHLYPVNYSISSIEDILNLLEYDIIYELMANPDVQLNETSLNESELLQWFAIEHLDEILLPLIELIPKVGKPLAPFLKVLSKYPKFKRDNAKLNSDAENVKRLMQKVEGKPGSIYFRDIYLNFIESSLTEIKKKNKKENVLIIDDLDRIDPEHVFRLFNVFAAYFDLHHDRRPNKFGFDKVIFVCDIDNIRKIFEHKYGGEVDFTGYIDKFFSTEIFQMDNRFALKKFINNTLGTSLSSHSAFLLYDILDKMASVNVISFRNIKNISQKDFLLKKKLIRPSEYDKLYFTDIAIILSMICGNTKSLIKNIERCEALLTARGDAQLNDTNMPEYFTQFLVPAAEWRQFAFSFHHQEITFSPYNYMQGSAHNSFIYCFKKDHQGKTHIEINPRSDGETKLRQTYHLVWKIILRALKLMEIDGII